MKPGYFPRLDFGFYQASIRLLFNPVGSDTYSTVRNMSIRILSGFNPDNIGLITKMFIRLLLKSSTDSYSMLYPGSIRVLYR